MNMLRPASNSLTGMFSKVIPVSIKRQALEGFMIIAKSFDEETVRNLALQDVSIWNDIFPSELREGLVKYSKPYRLWINLATPQLILEWMQEVRPDYVPIIRNNYLWFERQVTEMKGAVTSVSN